MSLPDMECERCCARVERRGDHLCDGCATHLGRDPSLPFWGAFPRHPDARLNITPQERHRAHG